MQFTHLVRSFGARAVTLAIAAASVPVIACGGGTGGTTGSAESTPDQERAQQDQANMAQTQSQAQALTTGSVSANGVTEYAPYFYTWGWDNSAYPFTSLVDMKAKTGTNGATLAFVLASSGTCAPSIASKNHKADIDAFVAGGGKLKASFGGQSGTYLESACPDAASLAAAISYYVDSTGIKDLDFDIEKSSVMNATMNARRAQAIATVQRNKGIKVSFTLAAVPRTTSGVPGGMTAASVDVVKAALAAGVKLSHVNLMTMDYGTSYSAGRTMGDLAISAVTDGAAQMRTLIPGLTTAASMSMMGATPMIGKNDEPTETFTVADASKLSSFARANKLGLLAFWAIQRDQPCPSGGDLSVCSQAQSTKFAFDKAFKSAL